MNYGILFKNHYIHPEMLFRFVSFVCYNILHKISGLDSKKTYLKLRNFRDKICLQKKKIFIKANEGQRKCLHYSRLKLWPTRIFFLCEKLQWDLAIKKDWDMH